MKSEASIQSHSMDLQCVAARKRVIVHIISSLGGGGAEATLFRLISETKSEYDHRVISLTTAGLYGAKLVAAGVPVYSLEMKNLRGMLRALQRLSALLKKLNPDLVHTWLYHADLLGGWMAWCQGIPVIWCVRSSSQSIERLTRSRKLLLTLCGLTSRFVPKWIVYCASSAVSSHVRWGYKKNKAIVICNGYDASKLRRDVKRGAAWRIANSIPLEAPLLTMIARWHPDKNHELLFESLAILDRRNSGTWFCVLVGRGLVDSNEELHRLLSKHGVGHRVLLLGHQEDTHSLMSAVDICVLSSATEGFPNVIAECMLYGVPAISTDVGDAALIIGNTGWTVPVGHPSILADAIGEALNERKFLPSRWVHRSIACRERIESKYGIEGMKRQYRELWDSVA